MVFNVKILLFFTNKVIFLLQWKDRINFYEKKIILFSYCLGITFFINLWPENKLYAEAKLPMTITEKNQLKEMVNIYIKESLVPKDGKINEVYVQFATDVCDILDNTMELYEASNNIIYIDPYCTQPLLFFKPHLYYPNSIISQLDLVCLRRKRTEHYFEIPFLHHNFKTEGTRVCVSPKVPPEAKFKSMLSVHNEDGLILFSDIKNFHFYPEDFNCIINGLSLLVQNPNILSYLYGNDFHHFIFQLPLSKKNQKAVNNFLDVKSQAEILREKLWNFKEEQKFPKQLWESNVNLSSIINIKDEPVQKEIVEPIRDNEDEQGKEIGQNSSILENSIFKMENKMSNMDSQKVEPQQPIKIMKFSEEPYDKRKSKEYSQEKRQDLIGEEKKEIEKKEMEPQVDNPIIISDKKNEVGKKYLMSHDHLNKNQEKAKGQTNKKELIPKEISNQIKDHMTDIINNNKKEGLDAKSSNEETSESFFVIMAALCSIIVLTMVYLHKHYEIPKETNDIHGKKNKEKRKVKGKKWKFTKKKEE